MENEQRRNDDSEAGQGVTPHAAEKRGSNDQKKTDPAKQGRTNNRKRGKKSLRELWRNSSALKKAELILLTTTALGALAGIAYLLAYISISIWQSSQARSTFETEHRPKVIFSRPPQFAVIPVPQEIQGLMACKVDADNVRLQTGTIHLWVKNIGNEDASGAFLIPNVKIVPEQKIGVPLLDDPPSVTEDTCKKRGKPLADLYPIYRGEEIDLPIRQVAEVYPFSPGKHMSPDAKFNLYAVFCIDYSGSDGTPYASCATYRLSVSGEEGSLNPFSFFCDGKTLTGTFQPTFAGYCEK